MAEIGMGEVIRVNRYSLSKTDIIRMIVIAFLVISCTLITAISFSLPLTLIRYELFFIPVLYTTYFYARRGLVVAGICGIVYLALGYFYRYPDPAALVGLSLGALFFILIASLMTFFIRRNTKAKSGTAASLRIPPWELSRLLFRISG